MDKIKELETIINDSSGIVFFGGAGVSTESGIKDFRSQDGLYNETYDYPPEEILSHTFFMNNTEEFYKFYYDKLINDNVLPNYAHKFLKELEDKNKLIGIVTQNIDGLHEMAGSSNVFDIHGSIERNYCMDCNKFYSLEDMLKFKPNVPKCTCGGLIKPDVVLYEEPLNDETVSKAIDAISKADTLIIGGTSLKVYPAASFIRYFNGKHLVIINREPLGLYNALEINDSIGKTFERIKVK